MGKPQRSKPGKKPPAPSVRRRRGRRVRRRAQIAGEICAAFERHADEELLSIIGSWRDRLDDREALSLLRDYNSGRPTLHRAQ